jgi:NAD(P)-dependent dehydrogenase (short-subunit alcohol dehydrogenase family)
VNVTGVFYCYKYAAQQMIAQGDGGRIIGASSLAGKRGKFTRYHCRCFVVIDDMPLQDVLCSAPIVHQSLQCEGSHNLQVQSYAIS